MMEMVHPIANGIDCARARREPLNVGDNMDCIRSGWWIGNIEGV